MKTKKIIFSGKYNLLRIIIENKLSWIKNLISSFSMWINGEEMF